jgi:C1A family cysteine protease
MYKFGLKELNDPRRGKFPKYVPNKLALIEIPSVLDYSNVFPDSQNQEHYGCCVAFGTGKVFEYWRRKIKGLSDVISKRALFSEIKHKFYPADIESDDGAQVSDGLLILEQNYVLNVNWPYEAAASFQEIVEPVPANLLKTDFEFKNFASVNIDVNDLEAALFQHGPLVIGTNWAVEWMNPGPDGRLLPGVGSAGGHCVAIIGFNRDFENIDLSKGAYLVNNNWSRDWGKNGNCYLPYNQTHRIRDAFTVVV